MALAPRYWRRSCARLCPAQHGAAPQAHCGADVALLCVFFCSLWFPGTGDTGDGFTSWEGKREARRGSEILVFPITLPCLAWLSQWAHAYPFVKGSALMIC